MPCVNWQIPCVLARAVLSLTHIVHPLISICQTTTNCQQLLSLGKYGDAFTNFLNSPVSVLAVYSHIIMLVSQKGHGKKHIWHPSSHVCVMHTRLRAISPAIAAAGHLELVSSKAAFHTCFDHCFALYKMMRRMLHTVAAAG